MKRPGWIVLVALLATVTGSFIVVAPLLASAAAAGSSQVVSSGDTPYQPLNFGDAGFYITSNVNYSKPVVAMASTPDGKGYWLVASDGGVFTFGDAQFYGSMGGQPLNQPIVGMAATPDGKGYWLVAADGGIFTFGDAQFYGSAGDIHLNKPVVAMADTPDGGGYWLVAADGGVFSFGDALYYGNSLGVVSGTGGTDTVGISADPNGDGYWLVSANGAVGAFGDAPSYGSTAGLHLNAPIVGMASTPDGSGYFEVASDGGVFTFGDAQFYGSLGNEQPSNPITAISVTPNGGGYWLLPTIPPPPPAGVPSLGIPAGHFFYGTTGYGIVEPSEINNNGDSTSILFQINWNSWGSAQAVGTGVAEYVGPNQITSQGTDQAATVVAFNLGTCDGRYMYQAVEWYFPQHGESFSPTSYENICTGDFVENGVVVP